MNYLLLLVLFHIVLYTFSVYHYFTYYTQLTVHGQPGHHGAPVLGATVLQDPGAEPGLWKGLHSVEERSVWRRKGRRLSPVSWRDVETFSAVSLILYSRMTGGGYSMDTYSQLYIVTAKLN